MNWKLERNCFSVIRVNAKITESENTITTDHELKQIYRVQKQKIELKKKF